MKQPLLATLMTLGLAFSAPSNAHDMWLLPSSTVLSGDSAWVLIDGAVSNDKFYFDHRPLQLDNLTISAPDGKAVTPQNPHTGHLRSSVDVQLTQPGTYTVASVSDGVMAFWKENGKPKRWFGPANIMNQHVPADAAELRIAERHARTETYVTLGAPTPVNASDKGLALRMLTHPNDLFAGETANFVLLLNGQPAKQTEIDIVPDGQRYRNAVNDVTLTTNDQGEFEVKWPQAGRYWLHAEHRDDQTTVPGAKTRNLSYTVTFEVLPQ
jgi:uncharacterized GH25 family protein